MKLSKISILISTAILLVCLCLCASAETARVVTPSGGLNVRKAPNSGSALVTSVPNKALVEVIEVGETWTKITYQKRTGYTKTEFLRLPGQLPGKTVYADGGTLLLRVAPAEDASVLLPVNSSEAVYVLAVSDGWAEVTYGDTQGYVPTEALSFQYETPAGAPKWIREAGTLVTEASLLAEADGKSAVLAELPTGTAVTVTAIEGNFCLAVAEAGCGYLPVSAIQLKGTPDTEDRTEGLSPMQAVEKAGAALKKAFKGFSKEVLYTTTAVYADKDGFSGPLYHVGYFNGDEQYRYGALVDAAGGKVLFTASYTAFAVPSNEPELLPEGEVAVTLSAESIPVGGVVDITVQAWTLNSCQYALYKEDKLLAQSEAGEHFAAAYRAREDGEYRLVITVTDADGRSEMSERTFTVDAALPQPDPFVRVYSQKDGWWLGKKYRQSTLDKSGCAIFALSSALQRMGFTGEDVLPENMARTYALCLTEEGTNNERLVREASTKYGFQTKASISRTQDWIVSQLREGALFTFSVARGHIALIDGISEDGTMVHIVDSAPTATFTRIVNDSLYYQMRNGSFRAALSLEDIPGARWFFETDHYGGLEYWLRISYVTKRGVRWINPQK